MNIVRWMVATKRQLSNRWWALSIAVREARKMGNYKITSSVCSWAKSIPYVFIQFVWPIDGKPFHERSAPCRSEPTKKHSFAVEKARYMRLLAMPLRQTWKIWYPSCSIDACHSSQWLWSIVHKLHESFIDLFASQQLNVTSVAMRWTLFGQWKE